MNKFKCNDRVTFVEGNKTYIVIRVYKTDMGYKYDVMSLDAKEDYHSIQEDCLEKVGQDDRF